LWAGNTAFADGNGNNRAIMPLNDRILSLSGYKPNGYAAASVAFGVLLALSAIALVTMVILVFAAPRLFKLEKMTKANAAAPSQVQ